MFPLLLTIIMGGIIVIYFAIIPKIKEARMQKKLEKWNHTKKDVVTMHAIPRGGAVSHSSPFVVKLETWMRMAKIPYETDLTLADAHGPKGRFPWISLNGQHLGDSHLIIDFLKKKFNIQLGDEYSKEQLAIGATIRIMMDDHFFWGIALYRYVYGSFSSLRQVMGKFVPAWRTWLLRLYMGTQFSTRSKGHGIGLHSWKEIEQLTLQDLKLLSELLGNKKYILGDTPCEYDASVFGHLVQVMWGSPGSIYQEAVEKDLKNLKYYTIRIKETFYPDWDKLLEEE
ncbi:failed axon connections homolog [Folsomia candida]|uniref:Failed axon connections n=1 Tax=Folsomia candida TaxID=158441 RepID=A0A226EBY9_FOLCA|nr:failed axon connections homolog [Folsomia candida]OXA55142.1 Failed axon connections [Folsomia candida]